LLDAEAVPAIVSSFLLSLLLLFSGIAAADAPFCCKFPATDEPSGFKSDWVIGDEDVDGVG